MSGEAELSRELRLLTEGTVEIVGRVASSNLTFAVVVSAADDEWFAIYKPVAGERPLWDFAPGLHRRERAAYLLSEHLGWRLVPPTVLRDETAPAGEGSLQWFIEGVEGEHYFTLVRRSRQSHAALRRLALFDWVANNTDRKSGHVMVDAEGHVWGIDHGLCFAAEPKVRTVIWDFAGEKIPADDVADIAPLGDEVPAEVAELLTGREVAALRRRVRRLLDDPVFPDDPSDGYGYPWPLV